MLFPLLRSGWSVEPDEFREFAADNVLRYLYMSVSPRGAVPAQEVVGGTLAYVAAVLRQPADIARIERASEGFTVRERDGRAHVFDHLAPGAPRLGTLRDAATG